MCALCTRQPAAPRADAPTGCRARAWPGGRLWCYVLRMQRRAATPFPLDEVRDGFELAHAMLGPRAGSDRPFAVLTAALTAGLTAADAEGARRAATRMKTRLTPADTRGLDPRQKALLAAEVGGATGRRWLAESPPRPGFTAHSGIRACVRALAIGRVGAAHGAVVHGEDDTHAL